VREEASASNEKKGGDKRPVWQTLLLRGLLSAVVLIVIFLIVPGDEMLAALKRVSLVVWLAILLGMCLLHALVAYKWRIFLTSAGVECGFLEAARAHGAGLFAALFLPGLIATDVVRATMLARSGGAAAPVAVGSVADRLVDTATLVALAAIGSALATGGGAYWVTPAFVALALVLGCFTARPALRLMTDARLPEKIQRIARKLDTSLAALFANPGPALAAAALSLVLQAAFVLLGIWLARSIGVDAPIAVFFLAWPLAKLAILVPFTISGLGVREALLAGLFMPYGIEPAVSVVLGLLWQSILMGLALVGGAVAYGSGRVLLTADATSQGNET
jgi:uncharacterized protein (TIRG00374 family)